MYGLVEECLVSMYQALGVIHSPEKNVFYFYVHECILYITVYVLLCVGMYMLYMYVKAYGGHKLTLCFFLHCFILYFLRQSLSIE